MKCQSKPTIGLFGQIPMTEGEKLPKRKIDLAGDLIEKMTSQEFEPEKYHDEYHERFLAMVDRKVKGKRLQFSRQHRSVW